MCSLDMLQQCISVDVRQKGFFDVCKLAPLREQVAEISPGVTIAIVEIVITITILTITVFSRSPLHGFIAFVFSTFKTSKATNNK